jgi:RNA polymerase sigma-70 factor (ECF subfamily)
MESPTTTFDLLDRIRQGDRDAFTPLFESYRQRLFVWIHYKLSPDRRRPEDIEEILQETFLAACSDLAQFEYRSPGSFLRWLRRIAEHVIADEARAQSRQKRKVEPVRFRSETNPHGPEPMDSHTPSRLLAEREQVEAILRQLNSLPEQYREVILLSRMEGLTTLEISQRIGKTKQEVSMLLHRAIRRFREVRENNRGYP